MQVKAVVNINGLPVIFPTWKYKGNYLDANSSWVNLAWCHYNSSNTNSDNELIYTNDVENNVMYFFNILFKVFALLTIPF